MDCYQYWVLHKARKRENRKGARRDTPRIAPVKTSGAIMLCARNMCISDQNND